jgi:hypothetical protein
MFIDDFFQWWKSERDPHDKLIFGFIRRRMYISSQASPFAIGTGDVLGEILRTSVACGLTWVTSDVTLVSSYCWTLFQYLFFLLFKVYFLEELLSAFVTPLILCFQFRRRSLQIIDFLRNFTVDVQGVGDVCSFAQLDVAKHGDLKVKLFMIFFSIRNFFSLVVCTNTSKISQWNWWWNN